MKYSSIYKSFFKILKHTSTQSHSETNILKKRDFKEPLKFWGRDEIK